MPVNVVMPQMGESVAEGTVVRWIKKVGDHVERDEPLFEISTDKVDAEIPSPAAGTLATVKVKEGETVPVDSVVAVIAQAGEDAALPGASAAPVAEPPPPAPAASSPPGGSAPAGAPAGGPSQPTPAGPGTDSPPKPGPATSGPSTSAPDGTGAAAEHEAEDEPDDEAAPAAAGDAPATREDLRRQRSSPLVRRIAAEHHVDIADVPGSGVSGRVTKQDILKYIETRPPAPPAPAAPPTPRPAGAPASASAHGDAVEIVPLSVMRRKIAEHMVLSRRTSAHVHSVFEVDFTRVSRIREAKKAEYERAGAKLTFLSFIAKATVDALRATPLLNSSLDGDNIVYKKEINLGIAVALDWGLIVPVIRHADERNLLGLTRAIADLATRARAKGLKPEEVQGGTFTITNPGTFGAQFGMPIINQPQVAILGIGAIEKRAVVVDDAIAIRPRAYLTLGYDHRLVDGAVADGFMSLIKAKIEGFDPAGA